MSFAPWHPALRVLAGLALAALAGCGAPRPPTETEAWQRGLAFLASCQDDDGGLRSKTYGVLRAGFSTTALALFAISRAPADLRHAHLTTLARGLRFLDHHTGSDGVIGDPTGPTDYPSYTAAFYLLALAELRPAGWQKRAIVQVHALRRAQLDQARGWQPDDPQWGGFGLGGAPVPKPEGTDLLGLSVTSWVVEALRAAGVGPGDGTLREAVQFARRCQNTDGDGGFFFTTSPTAAASKAGRDGNRPRSYGTATADGLSTLLSCGAGADDAGVVAARHWLEQHFSAERVPGFRAGADALEPALRIYWRAAAARALRHCGSPIPWRAPLRARVLASQRSDGSWAGESDLMKEDDPLVATPLALLALAETD